MIFVEIAAAFLTWSQNLVAGWGYVGLFVISFIGSATIILPILPTFVIIFGLGPFLNPWLVGLATGMGGALGELVGYGLGRGSRKVLESHIRWLSKVEQWKERYSMFAVIVLFAATPLPDDITGIMAGMMGYDVRKFILACLMGKIIINTTLAWAGFLGIGWVLNVLGGI